MNQVLEDMLQAYVSKRQSNWEDYLSILESAYNSVKHVSTGYNPFMLMYGYQPRSPVTVGLANERIQSVKDFLSDHMDMLQLAHQNIRQAQDRFKKFADVKRRMVTFDEGDQVLLRVSKKLQSLSTGKVPKLSPKYYGPFTILKHIGTVAYKLALPKGSQVHPIFHVSCLRKRLYDQDQVIDSGILADYEEP